MQVHGRQPKVSGVDSRETVTARIDHGAAALLPDLDVANGWLLTVDGTPQSYVDLDDPVRLEFEYVQRLAHVVDGFAPSGCPVAALHLGAGALSLPRYVAATRPGSTQRAVDHDRGLLELVRRHLPWPDSIAVDVADARVAVEESPAGSVDLVIADVFAGPRVPAQVASVDFLRAVAAALTTGGSYLANLADMAPLDFVRGQAAGALAVFADVCLVAEPAVLRGRRFGNVLLLGSDGGLPVGLLARRLAADPFPARVVHGPDLHALIGAARPVTDAEAVGSPMPPPGAFGLA